MHFMGYAVYAQELNCSVTVNAQQVSGADKKIFESLQTGISEFMNNRKWTGRSFAAVERIECSMLFVIQEWNLQTHEIKGTMTVQARRPVFHSSYHTTLLNFVDKDFIIKYTGLEPLDYIENTTNSNLTTILAYYANMIIALTFDSYGLYAGEPYFVKAQDIVNQSQAYAETGWKASMKNDQNRYSLIDGYINPAYRGLRMANYIYHRRGMDQMYDRMDDARKEIIISLKQLQEVNKIRVGLLGLQVFFDAKSDELVNIFSLAPSEEKQIVLKLLAELNPSNMSKYQAINNR